jgi:hypothetical protein
MELSHLLPFSLLVVPLIWGIYGFIKTRSVKETGLPVEKVSQWPLIINSAVLYALAFNIIFFIQELFLALGKKWLGLKAFLYHNNHNWEGEHPMQGLAQGYGAIAILITGLICLLIAAKMKKSSHWGRLFILWMAFQGFAQSLPQFITAKIAADTDTGQAFTYLGIGNTAGFFISVACITGMFWIGAYYSKIFLQLAPGKNNSVSASRRFGYLFKIAVVASLTGVLLIIPFRIMPWDKATAPFMITLISVPVIFANAWKIKPQETISNEVNRKVFKSPVVLLILLLLFFQLILAKGVVI